MHYVHFYIWLFSLGIIILRFIFVVVCINSAFLIIAEQFSIVWIHQNLPIHPVDGHLDYFQFLQINLLWEIPVIWIIVSLYIVCLFYGCFKIFCLLFLAVWLLYFWAWISLGLSSLGVHWGSWICRFRSFTKFGKFSIIIYSNIFSAVHPFASPVIPMTWILDH